MARRRNSRRNRRQATPQPGFEPVPEKVAAAAAAAEQERPGRITSRVRLLAIGILLGALWGVIMCLILLAFGRIDSTSDWVIRILSAAGIGMLVATVFGTVGAARGGEPLGKLRFWRSGRG